MNKTAQLVVNFEKENYLFGLILMPIMIVFAIALLLTLPRVNIFLLGVPFLSGLAFIIVPLVKIFLYFFIVFFTLGLLMGILYAPFFLGYKGPAAILDQKGIWIKHHNFIPWKDIEKFAPYSIIKAQETVGIQVKNVASLSKQSDLSGKISIFWTKLFGTPHITLSNLDTENEDIIIFAHRHLKG